MSYFEKLKKQGYYIIAEIGVNYYDIAAKFNLTLIDAAKLMIKEAKDGGADAVKFQSYKAETLASKNSPSYWDTTEEITKSQYELFKKFDFFNKKEYAFLSNYARKIGIDFMSTPFDYDSVDYLYDIMNVYKISSSDLNNLPFIKYIAQKNKPIILSTGASNLSEIKEAVNIIKENNNNRLTILHCILEYPTPYEHANLLQIKSLEREFNDCIIGYSDHTKPDKNMDILKTAYLNGAVVLEKHFTLDKTLKGNDHYHAMNVEDIKILKNSLEFIKKINGNCEVRCLESEKLSRKNARRSIVAKIDIKKGEVITSDRLIFKRPGIGISPKNINFIIGKRAKMDIKEDVAILKDMIE